MREKTLPEYIGCNCRCGGWHHRPRSPYVGRLEEILEDGYEFEIVLYVGDENETGNR